jgi:biotin carboxyl carrier protein
MRRRMIRTSWRARTFVVRFGPPAAICRFVPFVANSALLRRLATNSSTTVHSRSSVQWCVETTTESNDVTSMSVPKIPTQTSSDDSEAFRSTVLVATKKRVGDEVETDELLVTLEVFGKLVVDVRAPYRGYISSLAVADGDSLKPGAPMVTVSRTPPYASKPSSAAPYPTEQSHPRSEDVRAVDSTGSDQSVTGRSDSKSDGPRTAVLAQPELAKNVFSNLPELMELGQRDRWYAEQLLRFDASVHGVYLNPEIVQRTAADSKSTEPSVKVRCFRYPSGNWLVCPNPYDRSLSDTMHHHFSEHYDFQMPKRYFDDRRSWNSAKQSLRNSTNDDGDRNDEKAVFIAGDATPGSPRWVVAVALTSLVGGWYLACTLLSAKGNASAESTDNDLSTNGITATSTDLSVKRNAAFATVSSDTTVSDDTKGRPANEQKLLTNVPELMESNDRDRWYAAQQLHFNPRVHGQYLNPEVVVRSSALRVIGEPTVNVRCSRCPWGNWLICPNPFDRRRSNSMRQHCSQHFDFEMPEQSFADRRSWNSATPAYGPRTDAKNTTTKY